jgi:hypothetical protein
MSDDLKVESDQRQAVFRLCEAAAALNVATDGMTLLRAEREAVVAGLKAVRDSHALSPATTDRLRRALERDSREG